MSVTQALTETVRVTMVTTIERLKMNANTDAGTYIFLVKVVGGWMAYTLQARVLYRAK